MAVLRIRGDALNPHALVQAARIKPCAVFIKGQPRSARRPEGTRHEASGINVVVSDADFSDEDAQIEDALRYLAEYRDALSLVRSFAGVEGLSLDFGFSQRPVAAQVTRFPWELLKALGDLGIELEISHYAVSEEEKSSS